MVFTSCVAGFGDLTLTLGCFQLCFLSEVGLHGLCCLLLVLLIWLGCQHYRVMFTSYNKLGSPRIREAFPPHRISHRIPWRAPIYAPCFIFTLKPLSQTGAHLFANLLTKWFSPLDCHLCEASSPSQHATPAPRRAGARHACGR